MQVMSALARASLAAIENAVALVKCRTLPKRVIVTPATLARPVLRASAISAALIVTCVTVVPSEITAAVAVLISVVVALSVTL